MDRFLIQDIKCLQKELALLKEKLYDLEYKLAITVRVVSSYADMLHYATGQSYIKFLVVNDENKGTQYTTYEYYPNGKLMWVASVEEN